MCNSLIFFAATYALLSAYFRFRAQPAGINGEAQSYRLPAGDISFYHNTTWYEDGVRHTVREIVPEVIAIIRKARSFVVMDVFLFNLHHTSKGSFIPTTRNVADAFKGKLHPSYFITDSLNTSYGTSECEPLNWLRAAGVQVCITNLRKLRDNNLLYAPLWRLILQCFDMDRTGGIDNPLQSGETTTIWAVLEALTTRGNHRKVIIADQDESCVVMITSANLEDSGCYFCETGIHINSRAVAAHYLEAEKAVARMSACEIPVDFPCQETSGDAMATPLMGDQIKKAIVADLRARDAGDALYIFVLFLSDRDIIAALIEAARRGAEVDLILDQNRISFGNPKSGFPSQIVAAELTTRSHMVVRWANTHEEEFHSKYILIQKRDRCIIHAGSANLTRRSLSNTNLEANVRVEAPTEAQVCQHALQYARRLARLPYSIPADGGNGSRLKYWWYRFIEASGIATF
jgi:hypothetical protein